MCVIAGPEKQTRAMKEEKGLLTAYHEMGHDCRLPGVPDPCTRSGQFSRPGAWATRISMPQEDRLTTRAELTDTMAMTLGGRAAEDRLEEITTGASNDIEKVTATAKQMVMRLKMSEKLGPRVFGHDDTAVPRSGVLHRSMTTDEIVRKIDEQVPHRRGRPQARGHYRTSRPALPARSPRSSSARGRSRRRSSLAAYGKSEEEVFGPADGHTAPELPAAPPAPLDRPGRDAPRPLPRPGLAGGTADIRGERPERPELA